MVTWDKIPADKPTLRTMSSTRLALENPSLTRKIVAGRLSTYPLQLIKAPIVLDSRQGNPEILAAIVHPVNLPKNARLIMAMVNAQVMPGNGWVNVIITVSKIDNTIVKEPEIC
jgi:hypothetical protein